MRIGQLAEITGTTPRTVRHYHAIGLLPVPEEVDGWRDYDVTHLARLARIRWLVDAGLSLSMVAEVVDAEDSPRRDLEAVLTGIDARIGELTSQRQRLTAILDNLEVGLSAMPPKVVAFYEDMIARAPDEASRRAIRRERAFSEAAYCRGEMPPAVELLYDLAQGEDLQEGLDAYGRIAMDPDGPEAERLAREAVARIVRKLGDQVGAVAASTSTEQIVRLFDLYLRSADDTERRIGAMTQRLLLEELARYQEEQP